MGRTKNTPKKNDLTLGNASLSTIGEFIPLYRKKRQRKQSAETRITSHGLLPFQNHQKDNYLGDLRLGSTNNILPETVASYKVSFMSYTDENSIILKSNEECVIIRSQDDIGLFRELVLSKVFTFEIYLNEQYVYAKVYLLSIPLPKFTGTIGKYVKRAFEAFLDIKIIGLLTEEQNVNATLSNDDLENLYRKIADRRVNVDVSFENSNLAFLRPTLRPYQKEAVKWMVNRETNVEATGLMHPLYQKVTLKSGCDIYLDKYNGWIEKDPPMVESCWKGGILADEMGLGKTMEVLALILSNGVDGLLNQKPSDEQLIIVNQSKKRKLPKDEEVEPANKKVKVTEEPVIQAGTKKSATYKALQTIYNRTLSAYSTVEKQVEPQRSSVQCICGSSQETGCVKCVNCSKSQHKACLGWNKNLGSYKCPQCWEKIDPIDTKATLIVAPNALRSQWCKEISHHLKAGLKVLNYEGYSATPIYPTALQEYDIVITTYNVLQSELRLTETGESLRLRNQRRYWPGGSPLVRVSWWRLCLDEAQTVETPGCIVSLMAGKIPAKHRWAVTGTPMAKGVSDIFGLIDYLKMEPYSDFDTWKHILYDPYTQGNTEPMYSFLSQVLWRTTKNSVLDQIKIPPQTHELHLLEFSAVEKFFYKREHEICARDFLRIAAKFEADSPLEALHRSDLKNLMGPLLSLRKACSDPSAARGKGRYLSLKKGASSMKDLLEALLLKNKNDCEESLRLLISSINGLAGIYLLLEDPGQAVKEYRKVLQLAAKFSIAEKEGKLVIDKLPLIHTMHNLAEVFTTYTPQEHTLRDGTLLEDCAKLEKQYIEKFMKETATGIEVCVTFSATVEQHQHQMVLNYGQWYSDGFDWTDDNNLHNDLYTRVETAADNANVACDIRLKGETVRTLLRNAYLWHSDLDQSRDILYRAVNGLYYEDPETKYVQIAKGVVEKAMNCHLRPQKSKSKKKAPAKCPVCLANDHLKSYEMKLYTMEKRTAHFEEMALVGSWKPRIEELLLKGLLALLKSKNGAPDLVKDGETHMLLIEAMKKEFKEIRKVWTLLDQQICAQDELSICKVRLQLKTGDYGPSTPDKTLKMLSYDQKTAHEFINLITPAELPHQELTLRSEESQQNSRLEALLGTRNYLGTLRQQQFEGSNPDPCPVCHNSLTNTWVILTCAHTLCMDCFQRLITIAQTQIQCCVCRSMQKLQDVAYIHGGPAAGQTESGEDDQTFVAGNYSRKVEAVVRLLLKLRKNESSVKVLLFSTWPQVLRLLRNALGLNGIKAELAEANQAFQKTIESFKDPLKKVTALLLPVQLGSKGLNLIEATHVILLEPLLNPAEELQAIGRVHRIGQTKTTVVHKFLIKNTVEESLHNAISTNAAGWEKGRVTVRNLITLFENAPESTQGEDETVHCQTGSTT